LPYAIAFIAGLGEGLGEGKAAAGPIFVIWGKGEGIGEAFSLPFDVVVFLGTGTGTGAGDGQASAFAFVLVRARGFGRSRTRTEIVTVHFVSLWASGAGWARTEAMVLVPLGAGRRWARFGYQLARAVRKMEFEEEQARAKNWPQGKRRVDLPVMRRER
jgi:hypothetical protein